MKYYVVDAFTDQVFKGNPAAVLVLDDWPGEDLMQSIATENNLSETAFAVAGGKGAGEYGLRWFTPAAEIDLCGHATLAAAYVIANFVDPQVERIRFSSKSGPLEVARRGELLELDFPSRPPQQVEVTAEMAAAVGVTPREAYLSRDLMLVLGSAGEVIGVKPDFALLKALNPGTGCIVTAPGEDCDFVSRSFFPKLGIDEDPVTGSAHCNLIPYWAGRLGRGELMARQCSRRGGTLYCRNDGERVRMAGAAALYARGELCL